MRGATLIFIIPIRCQEFQSTLPMRGATKVARRKTETKVFQSTLPMRGATTKCSLHSRFTSISIHAPHAGSDTSFNPIHHLFNNFNPRSPCGERRSRLMLLIYERLFQSTLPMRGATRCPWKGHGCYGISIHAPHAGSDGCDQKKRNPYQNFNPRSPCGERLQTVKRDAVATLFQSTLPMRGATITPPKKLQS